MDAMAPDDAKKLGINKCYGRATSLDALRDVGTMSSMGRVSVHDQPKYGILSYIRMMIWPLSGDIVCRG